jgi:small subunit ribosomal protein S18
MKRQNNKKPTNQRRKYNQKQRECYFTENGVKDIDYKDTEIVTKFINDAGKIMSRRMTGVKSRYQKKVTKAVKLARLLAFIPYCDSHRNSY